MIPSSFCFYYSNSFCLNFQLSSVADTAYYLLWLHFPCSLTINFSVLTFFISANGLPCAALLDSNYSRSFWDRNPKLSKKPRWIQTDLIWPVISYPIHSEAGAGNNSVLPVSFSQCCMFIWGLFPYYPWSFLYPSSLANLFWFLYSFPFRPGSIFFSGYSEWYLGYFNELNTKLFLWQMECLHCPVVCCDFQNCSRTCNSFFWAHFSIIFLGGRRVKDTQQCKKQNLKKGCDVLQISLCHHGHSKFYRMTKVRKYLETLTNRTLYGIAWSWVVCEKCVSPGMNLIQWLWISKILNANFYLLDLKCLL